MNKFFVHSKIKIQGTYLITSPSLRLKTLLTTMVHLFSCAAHFILKPRISLKVVIQEYHVRYIQSTLKRVTAMKHNAIKHLLDKAMADIEIYSGEQSNIRRGQRPSWILS